MSLPLFSLNLAYVNDFLPKEKFVSAGAGLQLIFGMSAMFAPFLCSFFMSSLGPNGLFLFLFIFQILIVLFGVYRMTRRSSDTLPDSTPRPQKTSTEDSSSHSTWPMTPSPSSNQPKRTLVSLRDHS